jgi:ribosomal-protein-serine acetyltransferase
MLPHLLTPGVTLEMAAPHHAEPLYRAVDANRAHLRHWMPWVDTTRGPADTLAFIRSTREQWVQDGSFQTVIVVDGEVAGMIGMHQVDRRNRATSLGYWIAEHLQGRGIVTAACRAYVAHALGPMGLHRVEIRCAPENQRSRAIPERLGFREEGRLREAEWLNDRFVDHIVYARLSTDGSR